MYGGGFFLSILSFLVRVEISKRQYSKMVSFHNHKDL